MSKTITQFCLQESQIRNVILQLEILQKSFLCQRMETRTMKMK